MAEHQKLNPASLKRRILHLQAKLARTVRREASQASLPGTCDEIVEATEDYRSGEYSPGQRTDGGPRLPATGGAVRLGPPAEHPYLTRDEGIVLTTVLREATRTQISYAGRSGR